MKIQREKIIYFLLTVICVTCSLIYIYLQDKDLLDIFLKNNKISIDLPGKFKIVSDNSSDGFDSSGKMSAKYNDDILRIKIIKISEVAAKVYIRNQVSMMNNVFTNSFSPYPGMLSKNLRCPREFLPRKVAVSNAVLKNFYKLYANDRLAFGACSRDLIKFYLGIAFFYCKKNSSLIVLEYFTPMNLKEKIIDSIVSSFKCS